MDQKSTNIKLAVPVKFRQADETDVSFIFSSWLKSFKAHAGPIKSVVYYEYQHRKIVQLLQRRFVTIACSPDDIEQIIGYMVHENINGVFVAHYAYVKNSFRKLGVLQPLMAELKASKGFCTHLTSQKLADKFNLIYNPYLTDLDSLDDAGELPPNAEEVE